MPDLRLYVFGSPQLTSDNTELILNTRKALALLTYLVVTNRPQSRDTLATMFWSETSQKQGRAYLRRALWTIKKSIGDAPLTIEGQLIQFNPESGLWLDVTEFRRLLNGCDKHRERPLLDCSTCLSQMETAAALYRDDFLAGFTLTDCPAFDDWQFFEAEQFRQTLATTLSQLLRGHSQQENYEAAIQHAQRWVTLDPLHEPAQQALMQLYHQNGQAAAALRQYKLWVQLLDDELGLPPSEATVTLYEAIQANRNLTPFVSYRPQIDDHEEKGEGNEPSRPSLASSKAQHHLPVSISPLLGRDEERSQLVSFLKTPDQRLVTLIGPGGMGKTHLALSVAETVKDQFSGGVHFVPLAPLQSTEPIISTIAETLGYQFYGSDPSIEQLLAYFADKELLLILDNFEHLLSASSLVIEVLQAAPRIKILVTSRERLNVQDETILVLAGMVYPDIANHTPSTDLAEYDALLLLQRQAKLVQADFAFNDKTLSEAIRICQLVQGVPLAIVLAIGWLEVLSLRDIRIEIERSLDFLETDLRDVPDRQRSIRAVFDGSWEQLSDRAQNIFMKLSIFRGGFTREAAEAIAGAGLRELRTLVNKTFVVYQQNKRYEIHELLRQYGYEKLIASGQENNIRQDHSTYFLEFMAQREIDFRGRAQLEAVPPVKANIENIRLAWDWALAQKQEAAIAKAVEGLHLYFATSGLMVAGVAFLDTGLQSLSPKKEPTSSLAWAKILIRSSFMRANTDIDFADLTADIEQCLQIAQQHQDEAEIAFCMHVQAFYIFAYKHDAARAIKLAEKALARFRALDDRFYVVRMLPFLAKYSNLLSDTDAMAAYYSETLELATQINAEFDLNIARYNLAELSFGLGQYNEAIKSCQEAINLTDKLGLDLLKAHVQNLFSLGQLLKGDLTESANLLEDVWVIYETTQAVQLITDVSAVFCVWAALQGDNQASQKHGQQCLDTAVSDRLYMTVVNWGMAITYCNQQAFSTSRHYLQAAFKHAYHYGSPAIQTWLLPVAAVLLANDQQLEKGLEYLALAQSHSLSPTGWHQCWSLLVDLHAHLKSSFSPDQYQEIWSKGEKQKLDDLVLAWLPTQSS